MGWKSITTTSRRTDGSTWVSGCRAPFDFKLSIVGQDRVIGQPPASDALPQVGAVPAVGTAEPAPPPPGRAWSLKNARSWMHPAAFVAQARRFYLLPAGPRLCSVPIQNSSGPGGRKSPHPLPPTDRHWSRQHPVSLKNCQPSCTSFLFGLVPSIGFTPSFHVLVSLHDPQIQSRAGLRVINQFIRHKVHRFLLAPGGIGFSDGSGGNSSFCSHHAKLDQPITPQYCNAVAAPPCDGALIEADHVGEFADAARCGDLRIQVSLAPAIHAGLPVELVTALSGHRLALVMLLAWWRGKQFFPPPHIHRDVSYPQFLGQDGRRPHPADHVPPSCRLPLFSLVISQTAFTMTSRVIAAMQASITPTAAKGGHRRRFVRKAAVTVQ